MFHGLCIPYIGKTNLSVKKPAARSLRSSLEQLTKSQLELICESYSDESFSKKEELVEYLCSVHTAFKKGHWSVEKGTIGAQKRTA